MEMYLKVDYNRHLEILARGIELLSKDFMQKVIKSKHDSEIVVDLLKSWHHYVKLSSTKLGKF